LAAIVVVYGGAKLGYRVSLKQAVRHCRCGVRAECDRAATVGEVVHEAAVLDRCRSGMGLDAATEVRAGIAEECTVGDSQGAVAFDADRTSAYRALGHTEGAHAVEADYSVGDSQVGDRRTGTGVDREHSRRVIAAYPEPAGPGAIDGKGLRYRQRS